MTLLLCSLTFVFGFIAGALVARKNKTGTTKLVNKAKDEINKIKS